MMDRTRVGDEGKRAKKKYIIGMLGSIDKVRRNYSDIINALKLLPENKRNDLTLRGISAQIKRRKRKKIS